MKLISSLFILISSHNINNSMNTSPLQWLSKLNFLLIFLMLIHAAYIAIIGGAVKFFLFSLIALFILLGSKFTHVVYKLLFGIITLISAVYWLIYKHDSVLPLGLIIAYVIGFFFFSSHYKTKLRTIAFFVLFIIVGIYQFSYFQNLKSHYAQYKTNETWQKYGAL